MLREAIEILERGKIEGRSNGTYLMWDRVDEDTIVVSTVGYCHMYQNTIEEGLLKLGYRYAFKPHGPQNFDRSNGRTTTFLKEPKETKKDIKELPDLIAIIQKVLKENKRKD